MRYLSVCSGIEAATVAWHPLGWKAAAYSEIEKFPSQVLAHHYPDVPNVGDMTKFKEWNLGAIDLLVGGTLDPNRGFFPDGPDIITICARNVGTGAASIFSRLSWTEAQA